jgi:hypothetical protein
VTQSQATQSRLACYHSIHFKRDFKNLFEKSFSSNSKWRQQKFLNNITPNGFTPWTVCVPRRCSCCVIVHWKRMEMETHDATCNDDDSGTGLRSSCLHTTAELTKMEASTLSSSSTPPPPQPTTALPPEAARQEQTLRIHDEQEKQNQPRTGEEQEEYTISFFPKSQAAWVRTLMTSLLGLLLVGLVLSLLVIPQYALVIILFWLVIMSAFSGLACILQNELQRKHGRYNGGGGGVFHPMLHAMARAVVDEIQALQDEWRQEILLIKADESSSSSTTPYFANFDKNGVFCAIPSSKIQEKEQAFSHFCQAIFTRRAK